MSSKVHNREESFHSSFEAILDQCLVIKPTDELLTIYDESLEPFASALWDVIRKRGLLATFVNLPKKYQLTLLEKSKALHSEAALSLPSGVRSALIAATAILNLLDGDLVTGPVRRAVIFHPRNPYCRLAHIPGISAEILRVLASSPIKEITAACEVTAWALGEANRVELHTRDTSGQTYILKLELEGWDNEPMMSTGVIFPGSWGNVPPGETFCCPNHATVEGTVCINGSIPGAILSPGEELRLTFAKGKVVGWHAADGSPGAAFMLRVGAAAAERGDQNWDTFAELGVGLNPAITALTGNSLFDEKAVNTIHIALGDNSTFGHAIEASIHADLVTCGASLSLDGKEVIIDGQLAKAAIEQDRGGVLNRELLPLTPDARIGVRETKMVSRNGRLERQLSSDHRIGYVALGNDLVGRLLHRVVYELKAYDRISVRDLIQSHPSFDDVPTGQLLALLHHYRILELGSIQ